MDLVFQSVAGSEKDNENLGGYITHRPKDDTADSARNCISNIRAAGTSVADAAASAVQLILAMRYLGKSGVALNVAMKDRPLLGGAE